MPVNENSNRTIEINGLSFIYPGIDGHPPPGSTPLIDNFSLSLQAGDRCLLVGSNGAGKTTILKILGGKHLVEPDMVRVLGRSAFHDTALTTSGDLSYLGGEWKREVAFAGFGVAMQMDISAEKMIFGVSGIDPERRSELITVLGIDLSWRMHKASDGQRRRVQICMGLLKPFKVLLLDEITVDLDVLARADLLKFLKKECEDRGASIVYATHIFDGLEDWPSHIVYIARGELQLAMPMEELKKESNLSLMRTVEKWLRKERDEDIKRRNERKANGLPELERKANGLPELERKANGLSELERKANGLPVLGRKANGLPVLGRQVNGCSVLEDPAIAATYTINNGWAAGRLSSTVAGEENFVLSSNRVLR